MYRSRLDGKLDDITLEFLSSISDDAAIAQYDILGSQAHTLMLFENKIITRQEAAKILSALEKLKKEDLSEKSDAEDIHELIESLVIKKAGKEAGGKMHTARSRNDQVALDIRMKIRDDINVVCFCLNQTIETLVDLAGKNSHVIMPLYTHMQQAQVGLFSHFLLAYADALFRDLDRFYVAYGRINESPLGAGPVGGTSIPIDRQSTAKMLGFKGLVENSIDATTSRDFVAEYVGNAAIMMTNLSRMAEDFIIWSTSEFSFIELADRFTSTSSVMPQKKNPDVLELIRGKTSQVIGYQMAVLSNLKGLPSGYNRDLQQVKVSIWPTSKIIISSLLVINSLLKTMKVNEKKLRQAIEGGYSISLDIAEALVRKGIPFRNAHRIVGNLVQIASNTKKPLLGLSIEDMKGVIHENEIDTKELYKIIQSATPDSSLDTRKSQGSSGKHEQLRMIENRKRKVQAYMTGTSKRTSEVRNSLEALNHSVTTLIEGTKN
ncbi:MAG TPA: argininosuccinate lyase [Candidatus Nitrosotalea sp.]|nr:argininosuccinate lyase [Candidatus Nitrosotalea sp.]